MRKRINKLTVKQSFMLVLALLLMATGGFVMNIAASEQTEPVSDKEPVIAAETSESSEADTFAIRQDGERFEDVIAIEGMEETVRYEHIRNDEIGFEMDYDYDRFERRTESDREYFVSCYDDPENPENYLEVKYSADDVDTVVRSVSEILSSDYDIIEESYMLDRAGSCIRIDASCARGGKGTPDLLQMVYIVPAAEGSFVAAAHYSFESAEGFGRRFACMMNTFSIIDRKIGDRITDEQALSAIKEYCYINNPDLESIENNGEYPVYWEIESGDDSGIVVLFRSYTGAEIRYYIDPVTGETYVTEFVPGITSEEERTDETFNVLE